MHLAESERLANPVWHALRSNHSHLGTVQGLACRYHPDVAPYAALERASEGAWSDLWSLLPPSEPVWLIDEEPPPAPGLLSEGTLPCLQMWMPPAVKAPTGREGIETLSCQQGPEMVALTDVAFPGFFRVRTCAMGFYFGIRSAEGELVAMAGERLHPPGFPEVSGVCTHPAYRGRGFAAALMWRVIENRRQQGEQPWLYVGAANANAIGLYRSMGFETLREVVLRRVCKPPADSRSMA